ncbi:MAG: hypothetical protein JWL69_417 [Phycisphaerales bacterium]|nr:hypothetical protein [Phycisphaerales bacterium]MDB5355595.1 hypothetical protein [Phycisphaerales bacterium]
MPREEIERQAKLLAKENRKGEPDITSVYWFPDENEVRLVEVLPSVPASHDRRVHPYFFRPAPQDGLPAPSGVALIGADDFGKLQLPPNWGDWNSAVELEDEE